MSQLLKPLCNLWNLLLFVIFIHVFVVMEIMCRLIRVGVDVCNLFQTDNLNELHNVTHI